ncbi:MAG TPA: glutamate--tRNA ligase [Pseudomonadales bacterium]|nr:glutamate--tRNA ligase [Pseudomonadales bacterium]
MKTRFAPSPTGLMHLGNTRTALFNVLAARKSGDCFLLRIEDTDLARSEERFTQQLMDDLRWLGLQWQEGPEVGGEHAPYFQAQRNDVYQHYYDELQHRGLAYPCFCSEERLALTRKIQLSQGEPPRYPGTCASLTPAEVEKKLAEGIVPTIRFRVPRDESIEFDDLVRGKQSFKTNDLGDFIIRKADQSASFMFCNAIDDSIMGVTHVLRGEDHLTNTPRQLLLLKALGMAQPQYGHISIILGHDGSPLSKRNGSRSIQELRHQGYLAPAINNYLARLGHHYAENHFMSLDELSHGFSFENLVKSAAKFDEDHLRHWQKEAILRASDEEIWQWFGEQVHQLVPTAHKDAFVATVRPNALMPHDAVQWANNLFGELEITDEAMQLIAATPNTFYAAAIEAMTRTGADWKALTEAVKQATGAKGKQLFQPLRAALTGQAHGPEMPGITQMLGVERMQQRLLHAKDLASEALS